MEKKPKTKNKNKPEKPKQDKKTRPPLAASAALGKFPLTTAAAKLVDGSTGIWG